MRAIKHALTERFYAWEDAVKLAENDPEVNLSGNGPAFTPSNFLEESEVDAAGEAEPPVAEAVEETTEQRELAAAAAPDPSTIPAPKEQAEAPRL